MRTLFLSLSLTVVMACGDSTIELHGHTAPLSSSARETPVPSASVTELPEFGDAGGTPGGEPIETPSDAGSAGGGGGGAGDGGGGEPIEEPVDAGPTPECEPTETRTCTTSCGSTGVQRCSEGTWQTCERPPEVCSNGRDDDCDGAVDARDRDCPPTIVRCESTEGNTCNDDPGYGDHCGAQWNTGGCSAERFSNWCNRRNEATPDRWDDYIADWVDARCDGTLVSDGNTFRCVSSSNHQFECTTPLVLVFEGDTTFPLGPSRSFEFIPGQPVRTSWPRPATPWLARDLNHDGRINDGSELFGSSTVLPSGARAKHGFEALAPLDANGDGLVDAKDPAFAELLLWNGETLVPLSARAVSSLSVRFEVRAACDVNGNCEREQASFTAHGLSGTLIDLYLRTATPGM